MRFALLSLLVLAGCPRRPPPNDLSALPPSIEGEAPSEAPPSPEASEADRLFKAAEPLFGQGRYAEAGALLEQESVMARS